jgi:catechol 2,3-dioxygenase-like lactoylglutathione lyase family enzyme
MTVQRMDHVGIVVGDLQAAVGFFAEVGLELQGEMTMEGHPLVDRLLRLEGVRTSFAFMRTPDGHSQLELIQFHSPPMQEADPHAPAHTAGLRHITFAVDDIKDVLGRLQARGAELVGELVNYEDMYWLCYVRGPEGIIVELAEQIG